MAPVLFDAVVIAITADAAKFLAMQPAAVGFVSDAFSHLKVIGHTPGAEALLNKAGVIPDEGIVALDSSNAASTFVNQASKGRVWPREAKVRPVL